MYCLWCLELFALRYTTAVLGAQSALVADSQYLMIKQRNKETSLLLYLVVHLIEDLSLCVLDRLHRHVDELDVVSSEIRALAAAISTFSTSAGGRRVGVLK